MIWPMATWAVEGVALVCLLAGTANDIMLRIIPNRLVLAVMAAGLGLRLITEPGLPWPSVAASTASLGFFGVLATLNFIGWGDAKIIAAVTLLVPPHDVVSMLFAIVIAGGILACIYLVLRRALRLQEAAPPRPADEMQRGIVALVARETARIRTDQPMPYAVAVFGGTAYQTTIEVVRCWPAMSCWQ
jgi:prepilin peptidase CpaA